MQTLTIKFKKAQPVIVVSDWVEFRNYEGMTGYKTSTEENMYLREDISSVSITGEDLRFRGVVMANAVPVGI